MKYNMTVIIADPNTPEGMTSDIVMKLTASFVHDTEQYGNGHYVSISGGEFYRQVIDLRYDARFDPDNKTAFLEKWARSYWSGEDGAYFVKSLEITPAE